MEKLGIQKTLCIMTYKTQKTKTMATPTLQRNMGVYTGVPNNIKYEVIALVEMQDAEYTTNMLTVSFFNARLVFKNAIEKSLKSDKPDTLSTQIHER